MITFREFDPAQHLDSQEACAEYLAQVFADGDFDEMKRAVYLVAKSRGVAAVARGAGMSVARFEAMFARGARPGFESVMRVVGALGFALNFAPVAVGAGSGGGVRNGGASGRFGGGRRGGDKQSANGKDKKPA